MVVYPFGRMITITYYTRADRSKRPERTRDYATWPLALRSLLRLHEWQEDDPDALPCWAPHVLAEDTPRRLAENVERLDLLVLDLDKAPDGGEIDLNALLGAIDAEGVSALVVESRNSTPEARRVRVVCPVSRPLTGAECGPARLALAETLGVFCDPKTLDPSRLFFAGRATGDRARDYWTFAGEPVDVDALDLTPTEERADDAWGPPPDDTEGVRRKGPGVASEEMIDETIAALAEVWPAPGESGGERHAKGRALGGWLARRGWGDDAIRHVVRSLDASGASIEHRVAMALDSARRARADLAAPGWRELEAQFEPDALTSIVGAARDPREPDDWQGVWSEWWGRYLAKHEARSAEKSKAERTRPDDPEGALPSLVVTRTGGGASYFVRDYREDATGYVECGSHAVHATLRETHAEHFVQTHTGGRNSKRISVAELTNEHALTVDVVECDFSRSGAYVLDVGGTEPRMIRGVDCPHVAPVYDAAADAWLRALTGGDEPRRLALHEWIASCQQSQIHRLATAIFLCGPHGIGKSLTPIVLSNLWGSEGPVALSDVVKQFNASMTVCPIVADDECKTLKRRVVSTADFRSLVQARSRRFEPKNKEQRVLHGAQRFVISANDLGELKFADVVGAGALDAIAERMLVIHVRDDEQAAEVRSALDKLRDPSGDVDLVRMGQHFAWIQSETVLPDESVRFLGADPDRELAKHLILDATVDAHADLFEALSRAANGVRVGGVTVNYKHLSIAPAELAAALGSRIESAERWDASRVREALAPLGPTAAFSRRGGRGGQLVRVLRVDRARIAEVFKA